MASERPADERRGEKTGWIGGWLGGFLWVAILSAVFLYQGRWVAAGIGLALLGLTVAVVLANLPWHHPATPFWKLMLPIYLCLAACVVWLLLNYDGGASRGLHGSYLWMLTLLLLPFWTARGRRWEAAPPEDRR